MINFHPLEVVGRGSETELREGENVIKDKLEGKRLTLYQILARER